MKSIGELFHKKFVYNRRMLQLAYHLSSILSSFKCDTLLDIGAGDGKIDKLLIDITDLDISGVDVLIRDTTYIRVKQYDGKHINLKDNAVDATMLIDVLHHTENPESVLKEAVRVASKYVIVKDHIKTNLLSYMKLRVMDFVGNKHYSVNLPYNYLTNSEWIKLFDTVGVKLVYKINDLKLYTGILHMLFDRNLHFIAVLKKES